MLSLPKQLQPLYSESFDVLFIIREVTKASKLKSGMILNIPHRNAPDAPPANSFHPSFFRRKFDNPTFVNPYAPKAAPTSQSISIGKLITIDWNCCAVDRDNRPCSGCCAEICILHTG